MEFINRKKKNQQTKQQAINKLITNNQQTINDNIIKIIITIKIIKIIIN